MSKILTIVIPTYNMEKYLDKCITSLIIPDGDLLSTLEVLVVNDGSKDSSSNIAHKYEDRYPGIVRVIDKENGNYGSCVNRGLKEAKGKYIKILDADDSFHTENFSRFLRQLSAIDVDILISDYVVVNENGKPQRRYSYNFPKSCIIDITTFFENVGSVEMHAVTYKTNNLRNLGYHQTEGVSYTDFEWVFSPLSTVKKAFYFPEVVYRYLVGRSGQTVDIKVYHKKWHDRVVGLWSIIDYYQKYTSSGYEIPVKNFMDKRLLGRVHGLYLSFLIVNRDMKGCVSFDRDLLSKSETIYKNSENLIIHQRIKNYLFVKRWRETGKLPSRIISMTYLYIKSIRELANKILR